VFASAFAFAFVFAELGLDRGVSWMGGPRVPRAARARMRACAANMTVKSMMNGRVAEGLG
jgi:hypothetical protein